MDGLSPKPTGIGQFALPECLSVRKSLPKTLKEQGQLYSSTKGQFWSDQWSSWNEDSENKTDKRKQNHRYSRPATKEWKD